MLRLGWTRAKSGKEIDSETRDPIDFSITFQSLEQGGGRRDQQASQEESLLHFRRLMESFRFDPVMDMASRRNTASRQP